MTASPGAGVAATCRSMLLVLRTWVHTYPHSQRALKAQVARRSGDNMGEINPEGGHRTRSQEGCTSHHNDFGCYTKSDGKPMEAKNNMLQKW